MSAAEKWNRIIQKRQADLTTGVHAAVRAIADDVERIAPQVWPRQASAYGTHPYARDISANAWSRTEHDDGEKFTVTLTNTMDYAGFVNAGFTRKGEATARPWIGRGSVIYTAQILAVLQPGNRLRGLTNG